MAFASFFIPFRLAGRQRVCDLIVGVLRLSGEQAVPSLCDALGKRRLPCPILSLSWNSSALARACLVGCARGVTVRLQPVAGAEGPQRVFLVAAELEVQHSGGRRWVVRPAVSLCFGTRQPAGFDDGNREFPHRQAKRVTVRGARYNRPFETARPVSALGVRRQLCPKCRRGPIFRRPVYRGWLAVYERCPVCGLEYQAFDPR